MTKQQYQDLRYDLKTFNDYVRGKSIYKHVEIWYDTADGRVWVTPFYEHIDGVAYDSETIVKITEIAVVQDPREIVDTVKIRKAITEIEGIGFTRAYAKAIAILMTR